MREPGGSRRSSWSTVTIGSTTDEHNSRNVFFTHDSLFFPYAFGPWVPVGSGKFEHAGRRKETHGRAGESGEL